MTESQLQKGKTIHEELTQLESVYKKRGYVETIMIKELNRIIPKSLINEIIQ